MCLLLVQVMTVCVTSFSVNTLVLSLGSRPCDGSAGPDSTEDAKFIKEKVANRGELLLHMRSVQIHSTRLNG